VSTSGARPAMLRHEWQPPSPPGSGHPALKKRRLTCADMAPGPESAGRALPGRSRNRPARVAPAGPPGRCLTRRGGQVVTGPTEYRPQSKAPKDEYSLLVDVKIPAPRLEPTIAKAKWIKTICLGNNRSLGHPMRNIDESISSTADLESPSNVISEAFPKGNVPRRRG
jgi:hypothetical protein